MKQSLHGNWELSFQNNVWDKTICLPSTTEIAKIPCETTKIEEPTTMYLGRKNKVHGTVYYRKIIRIPAILEENYVQLFIQRTKYTKVYIDGAFISQSFETVIPQVHELGKLSAGEHELVVAVDNALEEYDNFSSSLYRGHQYTDHTQTNWNGMMGEIELRYYKDMYIKTAMITSTVDSLTSDIELCVNEYDMNKTYELHISLYNSLGLLEYEFDETINHSDSNKLTQVSINRSWSDMKYILEAPTTDFTVNPRPSGLKEWNEYTPNWYKVVIEVKKEKEIIGTPYISYTGLRVLTTKDNEIHMNGNRIHLRGSLDCAIYPDTGVCPYTVEEWENVLSTMKAYGMNHYRFHSWCPPKEAFIAADRLGVYLQVELSNFANGYYAIGEEGYDKALNDYLYDQSMKVIKEYGNHPSLIIYAIGNEMVGNMKMFESLLKSLKEVRNDILYNQGANNFLEDPIQCEEDDVWIMMRTTKEDNIRASFSHNDPPLGYMQRLDRQGAYVDYNKEASISNTPIVSHEIGQFQSFPRISDVEKYTGALYADAYDIIRDRLNEKGLLDKNEEYYKNSGHLLVACYKEEIEANLRTNQMSGFQLLGLQDFSGQGTALIGVLDAFLDSKGFITEKNFRCFCNEVVVLGKFNRYTYELGQTDSHNLELEVLLYNYCKEAKREDLSIRIYEGHTPYDKDFDFSSRTEVYNHVITEIISDACALTSLTKINIDFNQSKWLLETVAESNGEYTLVLQYGDYINYYPLWIYGNISVKKEEFVKTSEKYSVVHVLDDKIRDRARQGEHILVCSSQLEHTVEGFYTTDFWCYPMFKEACIMTNKPIAPGTLGLNIKKEHEALKLFSTQTYSSLQWQPITMKSNPVILDEDIIVDKKDINVIVGVIDNFDRNHNLGLIYEEKIGTGRLVVCAADISLESEDVESRALYQSLLHYMTTL